MPTTFIKFNTTGLEPVAINVDQINNISPGTASGYTLITMGPEIPYLKANQYAVPYSFSAVMNALSALSGYNYSAAP